MNHIDLLNFVKTNNFKFIHKKHASYMDNIEKISSAYNYVFNKV